MIIFNGGGAVVAEKRLLKCFRQRDRNFAFEI